MRFTLLWSSWEIRVWSVPWLYLRGGRLLMSMPFARNQLTTMLYQELVSPDTYKDRDASKARRDILSCGWLCIRWIKTTTWKSASTNIGGRLNSALIMSCGTVDLLRSWRDNIVTKGLSNCVHMKDGRPGAHTTDAYMREGVTNESKSHPLVRGSWKYAWWHCLSKSERDAYPLISLSLVAWVIENYKGENEIEIIDNRKNSTRCILQRRLTDLLHWWCSGLMRCCDNSTHHHINLWRIHTWLYVGFPRRLCSVHGAGRAPMTHGFAKSDVIQHGSASIPPNARSVWQVVPSSDT